MENSKTENRTTAAPGTIFRIIAPDGSLFDTFTIPEESNGIAFYVERPGIQPAGKDKTLERAAFAFYDVFESTVEDLREINPAAAASIEEQLFLDE